MTPPDEREAGTDSRHPVVVRDLRLALPAVAGWVAGSAVFGLEPHRGATVAVILAAGGLVAACWAALGVGPGAGRRSRAELVTVAVTLLVASITAGLVSVRGAAMDDHPLTAAAGGSTSVTLTVAGFARPTSSGGMMLPVRTTGIADGGDLREVRVPTVLFADDRRWEHHPMGTRLEASVRVLEPRYIGDAPALTALGPPRTVDEEPSRVTSALWAAPMAVRTEFRDASAVFLGTRSSELLPSLVLGDEMLLPGEVLDAFEVTGLSHLQAVSGANTTFVVGAVVLVAGAAGAGRRGRLAIGGIALVGFVAVVGPDPAVIRAAGTGAIGLLAVGASRRGRPLAALAAIVLAVSLLEIVPRGVVGFGSASGQAQ